MGPVILWKNLELIWLLSSWHNLEKNWLLSLNHFVTTLVTLEAPQTYTKLRHCGLRAEAFVLTIITSPKIMNNFSHHPFIGVIFETDLFILEILLCPETNVTSVLKTPIYLVTGLYKIPKTLKVRLNTFMTKLH